MIIYDMKTEDKRIDYANQHSRTKFNKSNRN